MTLPATGPISLSMVASELGLSQSGISLNNGSVRALAGVPSGAIGMSNLRGKSAYAPMTVSLAGQDQTFFSSGSGGTASGTATCTVSGGSGGYTYSFNIVSNPNNLATSTAGNQLTASFAYGRNTTFSRSITVSCTVTDNTGHSVTSGNALIRLFVDPS